MKNLNETGPQDSGREIENNPDQEKIKEIIERSKQFVVISGPSGSGKTMAIKHLVESYGFVEPPFLTTRELRPGEQEIGGVHLDQDEFTKREVGHKIFLPARNYGNAYGYDLDIIFKNATEGKNIVVESPASSLTTDVAHFLPEGIVIGMLPANTEELKAQLTQRGLNEDKDIKIRLEKSDVEKRQIIDASGLMNIAQITPIHGSPENTLSQIDKLMNERGVKINK